MLADGRTVPDGQVIDVDVCIVGAGPAGLAVAAELRKTRLEVALLERGPATWLGATSDARNAENVGLPYPLVDSRANAIGGSLHRWSVRTPEGDGYGRFRELDEADFLPRPWVSQSGWPFPKSELAPYYSRAWELLGEQDGPLDRDHLPPDFDQLSRLVSGEVVTPRIFRFANPGLIVSTYRRQLENSDTTLLLTDSVVTRIVTDPLTRAVDSVRVTHGLGTSFSVRARAYVLACGGIENPRLLLASSPDQDRGVANSSRQVGRHLMEHPHYVAGLLVARQRARASLLRGSGITGQADFLWQRKYSLSDGLLERERLLRCAYFLEPAPLDDRVIALLQNERGVRAVRALQRLLDDRSGPGSRPPSRDVRDVAAGLLHVLGLGAARVITRSGARVGVQSFTAPTLFRIEAMSEQAPSTVGCVSLSRDTDAYGVPLASFDWQLSPQDVQSIQRGARLFHHALSNIPGLHAVAVTHRRTHPPGLTGGKHHMGTTRMHDDPRQGVVDRDCRTHDLQNLYVAGSSVFPTVGFANPTLTILALSLRLADHLRGELST